MEWTHETVREEAKKYETIRDFNTHASGAVEYAKRNNIMEDICSHMTCPVVWTQEALSSFKYDEHSEHPWSMAGLRLV
jgi:hypothetical protein